jgi:hypothetical protein
MSSDIKKTFEDYARSRSELERRAETPERRERLLEMAREYTGVR